MSTNPVLPAESVELPLLPLRDVVVFPHMVIPLFVGRPKSIKALEVAMESGKGILLVAQKSAVKDEPEADDLYGIGCVANILQMLKLPDGTVKVLVEGTQRAHVDQAHTAAYRGDFLADAGKRGFGCFSHAVSSLQTTLRQTRTRVQRRGSQDSTHAGSPQPGTGWSSCTATRGGICGATSPQMGHWISGVCSEMRQTRSSTLVQSGFLH